MAERKLTFRVGADVQEAVTSVDRLTAKLQDLTLKTTGTGDKFTQLDRNAETLAKRLGVELSGSTNKSVAAFQSLYDYLVKVGAPTKDIEAAFNALTAAQNKYQSGTSFWKEHSGMITAVGSAALAFGVSAVKAFSDSEQAGAQLDAVLRSTAGAAGITRVEAEKLADSLSKMSGVDDEAIIGAETMILRFTNIGRDVFPAATKAALDLSVAMGTDLQSAALMVGKALDSPGEGMMALQRATGKFTDEEVKSIKAMADHGQMAEAQATILEKLTVKFGGAAEAAGKTFGGSLNKAQVDAENFMESVGSKIVPMLQGLIDTFPTASTAAIGLGGAIGDLNISTGDLLIAMPLLKTALELTWKEAAILSLKFAGVTVAIAAVTVTVLEAIKAYKAQWEEQRAEEQQRQVTIKTTEALIAKAKSYGIEIERGTKSLWAYNAELFKAIAAHEGANRVVEKAVTVNKYHRISVQEKVAALKEELATIVRNKGSNEDYNKVLDKLDALQKQNTKTIGNQRAAMEKFAEVTQKDAVDAIKKEMKAFEDLDKAMLSHGGLQDQIMQRNAKLIGQFEDELPDALEDIPPMLIDIEAAYKTLGVTSTKVLEKQAEEARIAYEAISNSGTASARDIEEAYKKMNEAQKAVAGTAKEVSDVWSKQVSTIVTDLGKGIADMIVNWKSFGDSMIGIAKQIASSVLRMFIENLISPLMKALSGILGGTGGTAGSGGGIGGMLGGIGGLLTAGAGIGAGALGGAFGGGTGGAIAGGAVGGVGTFLGGSFLGSALGAGGGLSSGMAGLTGALGAIPVWGWAALGGVVLTSILTKVFSKDVFESGAKEVARDLGGVSIGKDTITAFLQSIGMSKDQFEGVRKEVMSSPLFLSQVVGPAALTQGKMAELLAALSKGYSPEFAAAFKTGMDTGNWAALNKEYTEWESHFKALSQIMPDWTTKLMGATKAVEENATATAEAANSFAGLADQFLQTGQMSADFAGMIGKAGGSVAAFNNAASAIEGLQGMRVEFAELKKMIDALLPVTKTWQQSFMETGVITDDMADKIRRAGGDIEDFKKFADSSKIKKEWDALIVTFKQTGVVTDRMTEIMNQYGGSIENASKAIDEQFLGSARAMSDTLAKMDENLGKAIATLQKALVTMIKDLIDVLLEVPGAAERAAADANFFLNGINDKTVTVDIVVTGMVRARDDLEAIDRILIRDRTLRGGGEVIDTGATASVTGRSRFATGGIVTRPTMALIGEAGPEAVIPLNKGGGGIVINVGTVVSNDPEKFVDGLIKMAQNNRGGARTRLKMALA